MLCKPFEEYIGESSDHIKQRRVHYHAASDPIVIGANSPFELKPDAFGITQPRYGALLIHGLLDCPFSLRDIGLQLKNAGILSRAVLLPGHGTQPADLLSVKYQEWINTVRYGIDSLRQSVDHVFLVGYSTGATLSIYHALHDKSIKGIVLLAPALKILPPVSTIVRWPALSNFFSREDKWLSQEEEIDYTKYQSVPFHPILELGKLINVINHTQHTLTCPVMMVMSIDDETVSAHAALRFFNMKTNGESRSIIYADKMQGNERIEVRNAAYPALHIKQMSHIGVPFSPTNPHYGQQGDYPEHSNPHAKHVLYGAYNRVETKIYDRLYKTGLIKKRRETLTYNPDFDYMAKAIVDFIRNNYNIS